MKAHQVEKQKCPTCGQENNAASCLYSDDAPRPGDASICIKCQGVHVFTSSLTLQPITEKDIEGMPLDAVSQLQRLLQQVKGEGFD